VTRRQAKKLPRVEHQVVAQFHQRTEVAQLQGKLQPPSHASARKVEHLPVIIRRAQWVKFADRYYYLRKEGLYRFWDWGKVKYTTTAKPPELVDERQHYTCVILYRRDILTLFGAIATIQYHGHRHNSLPFKRQLAQAKNGTLSLTCGPVSQFVRTLLGRLGWETRQVSCIRLEGEWDTWNDGHVLFEFYWPQYRKWVLADVNAHKMFVKNGEYLNAGEVTELIRSGQDFDFAPLTAPGIGLVDTSAGMLGGFPRGSCSEPLFTSDEQMKVHLGGMLAMPLLAHEGHLCFYSDNPAHIKRICRYRSDAKPMAKREWFRRRLAPVVPDAERRAVLSQRLGINLRCLVLSWPGRGPARCSPRYSICPAIQTI